MLPLETIAKLHIAFSWQYLRFGSLIGCNNLGETNLTASENPQYLTSPNYPMKYGNNLNCKWVIRCIKGVGHLHLKFTFFRTEARLDYLSVYDGSTGEEHRLAKLSGIRTNTIFTPNSTSVFLRFHTDSSYTMKGFRLRYLCVDSFVDHCQGMPCLNGATCQRDVYNYTCVCAPGFMGQNCSQGCGRTQIVLNATRGNQYLTSPNYPNKYPDRLFCKWDITCGFGRIYINVMHLATESGLDTLRLYDGSTSFLNRVASLSGFKNDSIFGFNSSNVYLQFRSDRSASRSGFRLKFHCADNTTDQCQKGVCLNGASCYNRITNYTCICKAGFTGNNCETEINECLSDPCKNGGTCSDMVNSFNCSCVEGFRGTTCSKGCSPNLYINANWTMGTINSTNYPRRYDSSMNCSWNLVCPGKQIEIIVVRLETESCCDYLTIDSGKGNDTKLKGNVRNLVLHYNRPSLRFNFISDSSLSRRGFNLKYLCLESQSICDINNPCQNGANCSGNRLNYICTCASGFTGKNCSINIDNCSGNRCQNNGTCIDLVNDYNCSCLPGFGGRRCTVSCYGLQYINATFNDQRLTSQNHPNKYRNRRNCTWEVMCPANMKVSIRVTRLRTESCCDFLYIYQDSLTRLGRMASLSGNNDMRRFVTNGRVAYIHFQTDSSVNDEGFDLNYKCENTVCESSPCHYGSQCITSGSNYTCNCTKGYEGRNCSKVVETCLAKPCSRGACYNRPNDYYCKCPAGYVGKNCSLDIDECALGYCKNGASCTDLINNYRCFCATGFKGRNCETEIKNCKTNPCYNNANCTSLVDGFKCTCAPGYTSNLCEIEINECDTNPCKKEYACVDMIDDFKCVCPPGSKEKDCESDGIAPRSPGMMLVLLSTLFIMLVQRSH